VRIYCVRRSRRCRKINNQCKITAVSTTISSFCLWLGKRPISFAPVCFAPSPIADGVMQPGQTLWPAVCLHGSRRRRGETRLAAHTRWFHQLLNWSDNERSSTEQKFCAPTYKSRFPFLHSAFASKIGEILAQVQLQKRWILRLIVR